MNHLQFIATMWVRPADIEQILERLQRVFEAPVFQFVLLQVLPQSEIRLDLEYFIRKHFPERPIGRINLQKRSYAEMMQQFEDINEGFIFLENFEYLLQSPDLYIGFNQRRDRIAAKPVIIIGLAPTGGDTLRLIQDRIPDFWSLRTFTLEIRYRYFPGIKCYFQPRFIYPEPDALLLGERKSRLEDLKSRLARALVANDNTDALLLLYRELAVACKSLALTNEALAYIEDGLEITQKWTGISRQYHIVPFYFLQCRIFLERGEKDAAASLLRQLDEMLQSLDDRDLWYDAQQLRGEWMLEYASPDKTQAYFEQLLARAEQDLKDHRILVLQTLYSLSWMSVGEWHRAFFILDGIVSKSPSYKVSSYIRHVITHTYGAADVLRKFGNAILIFKGAGFTVEDKIPETQSSYPFVQLFLGSAWYFKGLDTDFNQHLADAFRVFSARYGTEHPFTAESLYHWGQYLFFIEGPYPGETFIPKFSVNADYYAWKAGGKADQIVATLRDALHKFESARTVFQQHYTPKSLKIIHCQVFIAFIHLYLQNFKLALAGFQHIVQDNSPVVQEDAYLLGVCHFGLGKTYEYLNDPDASGKCYAVMVEKISPFGRYSFSPHGEAHNVFWVRNPAKNTLWRRLQSFLTPWLSKKPR